MCGIFALLNNLETFSAKTIQDAFAKGKKRGPENSSISQVAKDLIFGFHRLAINGLDTQSNQPLYNADQSVVLICNGEIYNCKELFALLGIVPTTRSDCEIILHLYERYGIEKTLEMIDGEYAFVLYDSNKTNADHSFTEKLYVARDPFGVRPLYQLTQPHETNDPILGFASELKSLNPFHETLCNATIQQFPPGTYTMLELSFHLRSHWTPNEETTHRPFFKLHPLTATPLETSEQNEWFYKGIQRNLEAAVRKRVQNSDRPVACLLSGGLDSSLIAALANEQLKKTHLHSSSNGTSKSPRLETFSIGLADSVDIVHARTVAEYLGTNHHEIIVTEDDMFHAIPEVIEAIESYDTTTVRASIGNYLVGKYIAEHSQAKVILNGDGSDEVCGGYLYMHKCPGLIEFDHETRRLLQDIHLFDVLRSDKSISSHGLEPRTPFLDPQFVQFYLSIPIELRAHTHTQQPEKGLLRTAFSPAHFLNRENKPLIPDSILWRRKEAFSDGVSGQSRSLYQIIRDRTQDRTQDRTPGITNCENSSPSPSPSPSTQYYPVPSTPEQKYYAELFDGFYPGLQTVLPYYWLPKYVNAQDASARTLTFYNN